jgi:hypothetical protein
MMPKLPSSSDQCNFMLLYFERSDERGFVPRRQTIISGHIEEKSGDHREGEVHAVISKVGDETAPAVHLAVRYGIDRPPQVTQVIIDSSDRNVRGLNASDLRIPLDAYAQYAAALALHLSLPIHLPITQDDKADTAVARLTWAMPILREHTRVVIRPTMLVSLGKSDRDPDEPLWMALENRQLELFSAMLAEMEKIRLPADKSVRRVAALDHELRTTADIYRQSIAKGKPPTRTVAEALNVSDATAWRRIQRAIEAGHLEPDLVKRRGRRSPARGPTAS